VLLSNDFQSRKFHFLVVVITFTLLYGWHTISQAQAKEASIEETLSDDVVFFKVVNVEKGDTLSIRQSASSKSRKLGKILANESCVAYLNKIEDVGSHKWVKITYKGVQGWVNLHYLKRNWESPCGKYYTVVKVRKGGVLNMRQYPTTRSRKVAKIPYNKECLIGLDKAKKQWFFLDYEGTKGWVYSKYLKTISVDDCDI
jgi:SH3-like domain-containing protein